MFEVGALTTITPRAVAAGPEGDAYLLGAGGWAMRYRPDGRLVALWPMPDRNLDARDIAVDAAGRVYVPWARRQPQAGCRRAVLRCWQAHVSLLWHPSLGANGLSAGVPRAKSSKRPLIR